MTKTMKFTVVGLRHHVTDEQIEEISAELPVSAKLVREPGNQHDGNAVAVHVRDFSEAGAYLKIGYLPRQVAKVVASAIDEGRFKGHTASVRSISDDGREAIVRVKLKIKQ